MAGQELTTVLVCVGLVLFLAKVRSVNQLGMIDKITPILVNVDQNYTDDSAPE